MAAIGYPKIPTAICSWRKTGPFCETFQVRRGGSSAKCQGLKQGGVFWNGWWQQSGLKTWYTMLVGGLVFFIFPNSWDDDPIWLIFFWGIHHVSKTHGVFHHVIRMNCPIVPCFFPFFTWLDFFSVPRAVSGGSHWYRGLKRQRLSPRQFGVAWARWELHPICCYLGEIDDQLPDVWI